MLDGASGPVLWSISDQLGVRPEYLVPVLAFESGLDPSVANSAGLPYYGLNQISGSRLQSMGIDPSDYVTWPASRQLDQVVRAYLRDVESSYGPLRSGIRVYQANFYPASLATARGLDDVIVSSSSSSAQDRQAYAANTVFDWQKKGAITPRDLGHAIAAMLTRGDVRSALASTYAIRPNESMRDPLLGDDFGFAWGRAALFALSGVAVGVAVDYGALRALRRWFRRR